MRDLRLSRRGCEFSLAVIAIAWFAYAGVSTADLYRCVNAAGKTVYTDSKATCPGAREHQPSGEVQSYRATARAAARPTQARTRKQALKRRYQAASEASWRKKKHETKEELTAVTSRMEHLLPFVRTCNRGGSVFRTLENGLRTGVSCTWLRNEVPKLEQRRAALEAYLDHGLSDDCRASGCLPGWLR